MQTVKEKDAKNRFMQTSKSIAQLGGESWFEKRSYDAYFSNDVVILVSALCIYPHFSSPWNFFFSEFNF